LEIVVADNSHLRLLVTFDQQSTKENEEEGKKEKERESNDE
jgi:hypothetical protein